MDPALAWQAQQGYLPAGMQHPLPPEESPPPFLPQPPMQLHQPPLPARSLSNILTTPVAPAIFDEQVSLTPNPPSSLLAKMPVVRLLNLLHSLI